MTFLELRRLYLSDPLQEPLVPEGCSMSPLCPARTSGPAPELCDGYLSYCRNSESLCFFFQVRATAAQGSPHLLQAVPLHHSCPDPGSLPDCREAVAAYQNLYPQVKEFSFCPEITGEQQEVLVAFLQAWNTMQPPAWCTILQEAFPEFFDWTHTLHLSTDPGNHKEELL